MSINPVWSHLGAGVSQPILDLSISRSKYQHSFYPSRSRCQSAQLLSIQEQVSVIPVSQHPWCTSLSREIVKQWLCDDGLWINVGAWTDAGPCVCPVNDVACFAIYDDY